MSLRADSRTPPRIDLWIFDLDAVPDEAQLIASLSPDEHHRASRFIFEQDRRRFCAARGTLRHILSRCMGLPARDLEFRTDENGKPQLAAGANGVRFNLSHSAGVAAVAVSSDCEVGVDIEIVRPIDLHLARYYFTPSEKRALFDLSSDEQLPAFFRCWTRKEAVLKTLGTGLSGDLQSFDVSIAKEPRPQLRWRAGEKNVDGSWTLISIEPSESLVCAVAIPRPGGDAVLHSHSVGRVEVEFDGLRPLDLALAHP